jgi:KDO2-lipid IV(A) lauroyltransferase
LVAATDAIPRPLRLRLARLVAPVLQRRMPQECAAVRRNFARICPEADAARMERHVRALFGNFACFFADLMSLNRRPFTVQQRYLRHVRGYDHLQALLASPKGFVAATAHLGNWELAGRLLASFGKPLHILMAAEQHQAVQTLLRGGHYPPGLRIASNQDMGQFMKLLMALRRGEIVAIQADRATGHRGDVAMRFFGAPACFPKGPFMLAAAAGVAVLPCFCLMQPDQRYDIWIDPAIPVARGQEMAALQQVVLAVERYVAMAPDQWFNFYDIWDTTVA